MNPGFMGGQEGFRTFGLAVSQALATFYTPAFASLNGVALFILVLGDLMILPLPW